MYSDTVLYLRFDNFTFSDLLAKARVMKTVKQLVPFSIKKVQENFILSLQEIQFIRNQGNMTKRFEKYRQNIVIQKSESS